jgi:hypothetical protein
MVLIAYTAYDQEDTRWRVADAGFDAHLIKPADLGTLLPLLDGDLAAAPALC